MARKFVTLNHHSANDYLNADVSWYQIQKYYITQYNNRRFRHASLSTSHFVAYMWKWGNNQDGWGGDIPPIGEIELNIFKDYLRNGGGHVFYGMNAPQQWPGVDVNTASFEELINSACTRITDRFNPFTGVLEDNNRKDRCYGIDAAHEYIGNLGENVRVRAVVNAENAISWIAYRLCGVERGEYAGPSPFSPRDLEIPNNPLGLPDWVTSYQNDFDETPFYWFCGLQVFLPFKMPMDESVNEQSPGEQSVGMHYCPIIDDSSQKLWASLTPAEKFAFIMDWLNGSTSPLYNKRVGIYFMSKNCKATRVSQFYAIQDFAPNFRKFQISPTGVPYKPTKLYETRLVPLMVDGANCAYDKWQSLFEDFLNAVVAYANDHNNENVVFFNDRESKDMVKQQYDGTVQVDQTRIGLIADYLSDQTNWQIDVDEWGDSSLVTRPPNNAKIPINDETEYYSLSEAWWYMLAAIKDIADGQTTITTRTLDPVLGPYDPPQVDYSSVENSYLVREWAQHDENVVSSISFDYLKKMAQVLYPNSFTQVMVGPAYTPTEIGGDRRQFLKRVITYWAVADTNGVKRLTNSAELLYLMAKALHNWFHHVTPNVVGFLPSHVLPKYFYKRNLANVYPLSLRILWFDLTQFWTMKPAVLQSDYR